MFVIGDDHFIISLYCLRFKVVLNKSLKCLGIDKISQSVQLNYYKNRFFPMLCDRSWLVWHCQLPTVYGQLQRLRILISVRKKAFKIDVKNKKA